MTKKNKPPDTIGRFSFGRFLWPFSFTYCVSDQNNAAAIFCPNIPYTPKLQAF